MAEDTIEYGWDEVDVNETITADKQKAAEDIGVGTPVGRFLCTVVESKAFEKTLKNYNCIAAVLKMRIDDVIQTEIPCKGTDGKIIVLNGKEQKTVMPLTAAQKITYNKIYVGKHITDEVFLSNPSEKEGMMNRRIFIATRLGLIDDKFGELTNRHWGQIVIGKQVIITTKWNRWVDKLTKEPKENVKVDFTGYDFAKKTQLKDDDFSGI